MRSTEGLTKIQSDVLLFLQEHQKENGYSPTREEIRKHFGWSSANAAQCHLNALQRLGKIKFPASKARAIVIISVDEPKPSANPLPEFLKKK